MKLMNESTGKILANKLVVADTIYTRFLGLLGKSTWEDGNALWLTPCNSIHMWFMQFAIDVIFVNRQMVVVSMLRNVKPWQKPIWEPKAYSIFELPAGCLSTDIVSIGNTLGIKDHTFH